jgi:hypothetical protein
MSDLTRPDRAGFTWIGSSERSRSLNTSIASVRALLALPVSIENTFQPMSRSDISPSVRVLTPPRNVVHRPSLQYFVLKRQVGLRITIPVDFRRYVLF